MADSTTVFLLQKMLLARQLGASPPDLRPGDWTLAVSVLALLVTTVYALVTYRLWRTTQAQLRAFQGQQRPLVWVSLRDGPSPGELEVSVRNVGVGPALHLRSHPETPPPGSPPTAPPCTALAPGESQKMMSTTAQRFHETPYVLEYEDPCGNRYRTTFSKGANAHESLPGRRPGQLQAP